MIACVLQRSSFMKGVGGTAIVTLSLLAITVLVSPSDAFAQTPPGKEFNQTGSGVGASQAAAERAAHKEAQERASKACDPNNAKLIEQNRGGPAVFTPEGGLWKAVVTDRFRCESADKKSGGDDTGREPAKECP